MVPEQDHRDARRTEELPSRETHHAQTRVPPPPLRSRPRPSWPVVLAAAPGGAQAPIPIGLVQGLRDRAVRVLAAAKAGRSTGFKPGPACGTGGTNAVLGRNRLEVLIEDDQLKPDVSKQKKATKLYGDD